MDTEFADNLGFLIRHLSEQRMKRMEEVMVTKFVVYYESDHGNSNINVLADSTESAFRYVTEFGIGFSRESFIPIKSPKSSLRCRVSYRKTGR